MSPSPCPTLRRRRRSTRIRWERRFPRRCRSPTHGVTVVFVSLPNTKIELLEPLGEGSPIASFLAAQPGWRHPSHLLRGGGHPDGARPAQGGGCARAGRRRAQDRRARQARAVPASEGFQRRARRTRAGLSGMSLSFAIAIYLIIWWTVLFAVLPIGVRTQGEDGVVVPGTPESAPTAPRLLRVVRHHDGDFRAACSRRVGACQVRHRRLARAAGPQPIALPQKRKEQGACLALNASHRCFLRYATPNRVQRHSIPRLGLTEPCAKRALVPFFVSTGAQ